MSTLTVVDLAKARAYAAYVGSFTEDNERIEAADWIRELADEVESQAKALRTARASEQAALADAARLLEERDAALAALNEILATVSAILPKTERTP